MSSSSVAAHSQTNSSNGSHGSKRAKSAQYRTVNHRSHVDESLFGEPRRSSADRSKTPTLSGGKWLHDAENDGLNGTLRTKSAAQRSGLPPRPQPPKSAPHRSRRDAETVRVITKDQVRDLRVPDPRPRDSDMVLSVDDYMDIRGRSVVRSPEEIEAEREHARRLKEQAMEESLQRKRYFKQLDLQRIRHERLSDLEEEAREKAQHLLRKAYEQRQDQEDEIKNLNELILNAKIQAIRDAQILEKSQIKKEIQEEELRLDRMMEMERKNAIAVQDAIDERRKLEEKLGAIRVMSQIQENEQLRLLELQKKDEENRTQQAYISQLMEEEYQKKVRRRQEKERACEEFKTANQEMVLQKSKAKEIEKLLDQQVVEYQKQKAEREALYEREQERIKMEKEKEVARLRSLQQRAKDEQAERDALRAKRAMEQAEREWRRKELEEACKKQEIQEDLERARLMQAKQKQYYLALEASRDRHEFEKILRAQRELLEKDSREKQEIEERRKNYAQAVREQIREREKEKIVERNSFFEEGNALAEEVRLRQMRLQEAKNRKLQELRSVGIPDKYLSQVERKLHKTHKEPL